MTSVWHSEYQSVMNSTPLPGRLTARDSRDQTQMRKRKPLTITYYLQVGDLIKVRSGRILARITKAARDAGLWAKLKIAP